MSTKIMNQYRDALLESMKHDLSRHQVKIYGNGSLPDGIHYYLKSLEEMTGEFLINSFLKESKSLFRYEISLLFIFLFLIFLAILTAVIEYHFD